MNVIMEDLTKLSTKDLKRLVIKTVYANPLLSGETPGSHLPPGVKEEQITGLQKRGKNGMIQFLKDAHDFLGGQMKS